MASNALLQRTSAVGRTISHRKFASIRALRQYSATVDKYALPHASSGQPSHESMLHAVRTRNPNTVWKKYKDIDKSDDLDILTKGLHSMAFRSIKPRNPKAYNEDELEVVQDRLFHIYDRMKAKNIPMDVRDYNHMLNVFGRSRDFATCSRIWQDLERTTTPNLYSYNLYMFAAVKGGQASKAFEILTRMREKKITPNRFTYDTLLKAHAAAGDLRKMDKAFAELFVQPNNQASKSYLSRIHSSPIPKPATTTFNALIDAHGTAGNIDGILHIYQNMMPSFNVRLIRWCCQHEQVATAKKIFFDMERAGVKPNVVTFNYLVKHEALKQGRAGGAYKIMDLMQRIYNLRPLQSMYNALIKVHIKRNRTEQADDLYREWQSNRMVRLPTERN
jgi:pentatricopeptide repeat protein